MFTQPCTLPCWKLLGHNKLCSVYYITARSESLRRWWSLVMWSDSLLIVFISSVTALLGELVTYLLVYRTDQYKRIKSELEKQTKRLESKRKKQESDALAKTQKKRLDRDEERLKLTNRELMSVKMKSMMIIGLAFTSLLSVFNSIFDGRIVAKLPFVPIVWLQGLSHRNLMGDDFTDCSFIFLYILCTMSIRQNVQKALGFAPSRAAAKITGGSMASVFGNNAEAAKYKW